MSRIQQVTNEQAGDATRKLFTSVHAKLGTVPNMMRAMGSAPAVLSAYLQFSGQLAAGVLTAQQREAIALAVGQANQCDYCVAAHSALGKMAGLSAEQVADARRGGAIGTEDDALVRLAVKLVRQRGQVSDADLDDVRAQGLGDDAIAEVIAHVALNIFTNYFNHVAETELDFPAAAELVAS